MPRKTITDFIGEDDDYEMTFGTGKAVKQPDTKPTPKAPAPKAPTPKPKAAPVAEKTPVPKTEPEAEATPGPKRQTTPKPEPKPTGEMRSVNVRITPKADHKPALDALAAAGLRSQDVLLIAGKRALEKFELSSEFVPHETADRMPTSISYRTTKQLDAGLLDQLREQGDPLRCRSDAYVIQGQLEPVFWAELDAVMKELKSRYKV